MFGKQEPEICRIAPWNWRLWLTGVVMAAAITPVRADSLDADIDRLNALVTRHAATVDQLEQALVNPVGTRLAVFLSLANREQLTLDSVELFLNDQPVASHRYSDNERQSLEQGGVHQLFVGHLANGSHTLEAVINARTSNKRFVRREIQHAFRKTNGTLRVQMKLDAQAPDYEPEITFREWD
jgi:hypothetical protein